MMDKIKVKEEGWQNWLVKYGLWDDGMNQEDLYMRYAKFSQVKFGMVPPALWGLFYHDLLPLEPMLVFGEAIGFVERFPFIFTVDDSTPIRQRAIVYPREQRNQLRRYINQQIDMGVLRHVHSEREPDLMFMLSVVLVQGGQSQ